LKQAPLRRHFIPLAPKSTANSRRSASIRRGREAPAATSRTGCPTPCPADWRKREISRRRGRFPFREQPFHVPCKARIFRDFLGQSGLHFPIKKPPHPHKPLHFNEKYAYIE
jgi:hypothetical protein